MADDLAHRRIRLIESASLWSSFETIVLKFRVKILEFKAKNLGFAFKHPDRLPGILQSSRPEQKQKKII